MSLFLDQTFASTGLAAILFGIVGLGCVVSWPLLPSRRGALMVQGTGFNWTNPDHFRVVTLPRVDDLEQAIGRIGSFLKGYQQ